MQLSRADIYLQKNYTFEVLANIQLLNVKIESLFPCKHGTDNLQESYNLGNIMSLPM